MNEFEDLPSIEPGVYRHYKGNEYQVLGVGCHTEAHEYYVVYAPKNPKDGQPKLWVRPYGMFIEMVEVNGKAVPRFERLQG